MDTLNQELSSLVKYGVSDQLIQALQVIEDTTDFDGRPLYEHASIYEMRCAILCRNYGKTLWEYGHFIAVLQSLNRGGVIDLFWGKNLVTGARLKAWIAELPALDWLQLDENGNIKLIIGKRQFTINPQRVNIMAAWTAFIAIAEPNILDLFAQFDNSLNEKRIDAFATHLKTRLDQYLEPQLQALHQQRQGRVLLTWLQEHHQTDEYRSVKNRSDKNRTDDTLLSDANLLRFWQHNALREEGDFKRFSTVADCAYRLHSAIRIGENQHQLAKARSYHQDKAGEDASWQLDEVSHSLANEDLFADLFEKLVSEEQAHSVANLMMYPLEKINFLSNKDAELCRKLEVAGTAVNELPLTFARAQVFGLQQARMTEDLRKTKGANLHALASLTGVGREEAFSGVKTWQLNFDERRKKLSQTRLANAYILLKLEHPRGHTRLLEFLKEEEKVALKSMLTEQADQVFSKRLLSQVKEVSATPIRILESAFAKVNRAGFKQLPDESALALYVEGDQHLETLEKLLANYSLKLSRGVALNGGIDSLEADDAKFFSKMFMQLYCHHGARR